MVTSDSSLLIAAFEPFGGRRRNRAWDTVRGLPPRTGVEVVQLPVDFRWLQHELPRLLERRAGPVLLVGEYPGDHVRLEQVALNLIDATRPDNAGRAPRMEPVVPGAPLALPASWNAQALAERLRQAGIPAKASCHAGAFACNASLYLALHGQPRPAGFLHVPRERWPFGPSLTRLRLAVDLCVADLCGTAGVGVEPLAALAGAGGQPG